MKLGHPVPSCANEGPSGFASGLPSVLLRLEGFGMLTFGLVGYGLAGQPWLAFFALFLLPDLSSIAYLFGSRPGSIAYNAAHTYVWPLLLLGLSVLMHQPGLQSAAFIWLSHIGADRALGFGFRYAAAPDVTHLGLVGRARMSQRIQPGAQPRMRSRTSEMTTMASQRQG